MKIRPVISARLAAVNLPSVNLVALGRAAVAGLLLTTAVAACGSESAQVLSEPEDTVEADDPGPSGDDASTPSPDTPTGPDSAEVVDGECSIPTDCLGKVALGLCVRPVCEAGVCGTAPAPDGAACDDGDACTVDSTCLEGACQGGAPYPCDDGNPCTADTCDATGCVHAPTTGGCDDGNKCSLADYCLDGKCVGGTSACPCEDDETCKQYNDGNLCTGSLSCQGGLCKPTPGSIPECAGGKASACEVFGCSPTTGSCDIVPVADGTACDDADPCTVGDTCQAGACVAGGGACICEADADCIAYDDGDLCNGVMRCDGGFCVPDPTSVVSCSSGGPCESGACNPTTGQCDAVPLEGQSCDDGNPCTTSDECFQGQCLGVSKTCDDGNQCTTDACVDGQCTFTPTDGPCFDGNDCTVGDSCVDGTCIPGVDECSCTVTADCAAFDDGNPCTGTLECNDGQCETVAGSEVVCTAPATDCNKSACNPATGACEPTPINEGLACFDGDPCTDGEICQSGTCGGGKNECSCQPVDQFLTCNAALLWSNNAFGATDNVDSWPCAAGDFSGSEFAWPVFVNQPTAMTVSLNDEEANTWLFVSEDVGGGCDPTSCKKGNPSEVSFIAMPGVTQYVIVDGKNGEAGKFDINVDCSVAFETACQDGNDDDTDGLTDCQDPDCENDVWCAGSEQCANGVDDNNDNLVDCDDPDCTNQPICQSQCDSQYSVYCGFSQFWGTGGVGSSNAISSYACGTTDTSGPEVIYTFDAKKTQSVTISMPNAFPGAWLAVMVHAPGGCNSAYCQTAGPSPLSFFAQAGTTYYIAVDGQFGAAGDYQFKVECQ